MNHGATPTGEVEYMIGARHETKHGLWAADSLSPYWSRFEVIYRLNNIVLAEELSSNKVVVQQNYSFVLNKKLRATIVDENIIAYYWFILFSSSKLFFNINILELDKFRARKKSLVIRLIRPIAHCFFVPEIGSVWSRSNYLNADSYRQILLRYNLKTTESGAFWRLLSCKILKRLYVPWVRM